MNIIKDFFILTSLLLISINITAQQKELPRLEISVLTCSAGNELYSAFGHSAIRVHNYQDKSDWIFNYGTFDFNTPNFYLKFINGKLKYKLSVSNYNSFIREYKYRNRGVVEQILNLDEQQKQNIFNALKENYQPQNRYYKYDFFKDNCATRIFNVLNDNIKGGISISDSLVSNETFREYLHYYLNNSLWIEDGLNLLLGSPVDKVATVKESTFLPVFLEKVLHHSYITNSENKKVPLVTETKTLIKQNNEIIETNSFFSPGIIVGIIALIILIIGYFVKYLKTKNNLFDKIIFFIVGFFGILLIYMWFATDLRVTVGNLNILWASPLFAIVVFLNQESKLRKYLYYIISFSIMIFMSFAIFNTHSFASITYPISIFLLVRIANNLLAEQ